MIKIQFLGAAGTVTGSSYLVTIATGSILVDLGMFQETGDITQFNFSPLPFDVKSIQAVFVTHAHLDHCGRLPLLIKAGYTGKIYMTAATKEIVALSLLDAAEIAQKEHHNPPLYTKDDVEKVLQLIAPITYDTQLTVNDFLVTFTDAGHILGSASIQLIDKTTSKTIVFSGDLGNTPEDLIKPTEFFSAADAVIMESTYGGGTHPQEDASTFIQNEINVIEKTQATLLIPAFSIERTQEILHILYHLKLQGKIENNTQVFLDSPMAIDVTEIFKKYADLYNTELQSDKNPFVFPGLTVIKSVEESKAIIKAQNPKVIIAGSGMLNGGRILHHIANYISLPQTRLLIVGYQAAGTLGREILDGAKEIRVYNQSLPVNAQISKISSLSSHADTPKLLDWLNHIKGVKKVFLTHGEDPQRQALAASIQEKLNLHDVVLPKKDEEYEVE